MGKRNIWLILNLYLFVFTVKYIRFDNLCFAKWVHFYNNYFNYFCSSYHVVNRYIIILSVTFLGFKFDVIEL